MQNRKTRKEPRLCDFNKVEIRIPSKRLVKVYFKKNFLDADEVIFLKSLEWRVETAENKIAHVRSLIDKAMRKMAGRT